LWQPQEQVEEEEELWQPPGEDKEEIGWQPPKEEELSSWNPNTSEAPPQEEENFHQNKAAAAADVFYSGLTRTLTTRADSQLFHMRSFNGWVKATSIAELDPKTSRKRGRDDEYEKEPLRVLDLACGKGGDLGKWALHSRTTGIYVGVDVARGSLKDAALRIIKMKNRIKNVRFVCADLGSDVLGRKRCNLLTWTPTGSSQEDPQFPPLPGGGIDKKFKFDVVSVQFAIHYMMNTKKRALRFFKTLGDLLATGGHLIATTIDARVVVNHIMNMGLDIHQIISDDQPITLKVGKGACQLQFNPDTIRRLFRPNPNDDLFGLEYTFTLVEGQDHSKGVGDAVNLPEWLIPIPTLTSLAHDAGFKLEYVENFHEFYENRKNPELHYSAHNALYSMHVLDRFGSICPDNWEVSRMYMAIKFTKVRDATMILDDDPDSDTDDDDSHANQNGIVQPQPKTNNWPMAMMRAKRNAGALWNHFSAEDKKAKIKEELAKM